MTDLDELPFGPGDLVDLAILGTARNEPATLDSLCERARTLCHPWLTPTWELVLGRTARLVGTGSVATSRAEDGETVLAMTASGQANFAMLMCRPLAAPTHDLRFCTENLKLAFLPLLDQPLRSRIGADMLAARQRCMACVERQLVACGEDRPVLRACLDRQRRLMAAQLDVVGREIADGAAVVAPA